METTVKKRLISRAEYYRMGETGVLQPHEKVELINGEILIMSPIGSHHSAIVRQITMHLFRTFDGIATISVHNPIFIDEWNEPEPDLALLQYRKDNYSEAHPNPSDVLLIIEVSDTSYEFDRTTKLSLYASSGIPVYWIIDLNGKRIEVYDEPQNSGYQNRKVYLPGDKISYLENSFEVDEILMMGEV